MFMIRRKSDQKIAGFEIISNHHKAYADDNEFKLAFRYYDAIAVFEDRANALEATKFDHPWYNASFMAPSWSGEFAVAAESNDLEVVEITSFGVVV